MAVAEATESGHALRGLCLLGVLTAARVTILAGHHVPASIWSPLAYAWQDVLVALLFAVIDRRLHRPRLAWTVYAWQPSIIEGLITGISNGRTEGYNRIVKHVGRIGFGLRNTENHCES